MNEKHKIVLEEMENQIGIYDGKDKHSGTGCVKDMSLHSDGSSFFCGFSKIHKMPFKCKPSHELSRTSREISRNEWKASAEAVVDELATHGHTGFVIHSVSHNGFIIEEEKSEHNS